MPRFTPSRPLALALAGTTLLSAATLATLHSQPLKMGVPTLDSALQVADGLDGVIQARFRQDKGEFGMSRILTINGHGDVVLFRPQNPTEASVLERADTAGDSYVIAFLHCAHVPAHNVKIDALLPTLSREERGAMMLASDLKVANPSLTLLRVKDQQVWDPLKRGEWFPGTLDAKTQALQQELEKPVVADLPVLFQGKPAQTKVNNWLVVMRPVTASQDSCLGCHTGAKRGDTLGVMVYAVSKTPNTGG